MTSKLVEVAVVPTEDIDQFVLNALTTSGVADKMVDAVQAMEVFKKEDISFLRDHKDRLQKVMEKTWMWRTDSQRRSIISDRYFPTLHGKFHQCILEQKVQFENAIMLAKDFDLHKNKIEGLLIDRDEAEHDLANMPMDEGFKSRRLQVEIKRIDTEIAYKRFELQQFQIQMNYRMDEVRGWMELENILIAEMRKLELTDAEIWDKQIGEVEEMFFRFLNNYIGVSQSKDAGEIINITALAEFAIEQAQQCGKEFFSQLMKRCTAEQLSVLRHFGIK